jgi:predicted DNA-binding transcriptional regulator AlpA
MEEDEPKKINTLELAVYLGISISSIYRYQREKNLPRGQKNFGKHEV